MRIPDHLLIHKCTVKPYLGDGAYGAVFGTEFSTRCRVEPKQVTVKRSGANGEDVTYETVAFFRPTSPITQGSEITVDGITYRVAEIRKYFASIGLHHLEAVLDGR